MRTTSYVTPQNIAAKTDGWLKEIRKAVPPRPHLTIDPLRCALLIVDMNRYFASVEGRCYLPASEGIIIQLGALLANWRKRGGKVVFAKHGHRDETELGMMGRFFSDYIRADGPESEIIVPLQPLSNEKVIPKNTYDAFYQTDLQDYLRESGSSQVLIAGVLTHMCCETTARSAFCRGFEVYIPADATASTCEERHLQSLKGMADSVAMIVGTQEVLEQCPIKL